MIEIIHYIITAALVIICFFLVRQIIKLHERIDVLQDTTAYEYEYLEEKIADLEQDKYCNYVTQN